MLTDMPVRKAKAAEKPYKMADGQGLCLLVTTTGVRSWRLDYRFNDKRRTITFGLYPDVAIVDARKKREAARQQLDDGIDPGAEVEPPPTDMPKWTAAARLRRHGPTCCCRCPNDATETEDVQC